MIFAKSLKLSLAGGALVVAMTFTTACGISANNLNNVLSYVDAAVAAVSVAVPGPWTTIATEYLSAVTSAADATAVEAESTDTDQIKALKISQIWINAALPNLSGVPAPIASVLKLGGCPRRS